MLSKWKGDYRNGWYCCHLLFCNCCCKQCYCVEFWQVLLTYLLLLSYHYIQLKKTPQIWSVQLGEFWHLFISFLPVFQNIEHCCHPAEFLPVSFRPFHALESASCGFYLYRLVLPSRLTTCVPGLYGPRCNTGYECDLTCCWEWGNIWFNTKAVFTFMLKGERPFWHMFTSTLPSMY